MKRELTIAAWLMVLLLAGCGQSSQEAEEKSSDPAAQTEANAPAGGLKTRGASGNAQRQAPKEITIPQGTEIAVRLQQPVGSKISQPGERFEAEIAQPVMVDGQVVVPKGASATGTVVDAVPQGKLKGAAQLKIRLDSITIDGQEHDVETATLSHAQKGKGKRTAGMIGGGAGAGAIIGGITGGGKGAAIGAAVGAGAGTAGAAMTGNKEVVLPVETVVNFTLTQPLQVR